jgi:predicted aldo/keto reductase-like oxidoreductase
VIEVQRRIYGNTDEKLSIIGFGGIVVMKETQSDANNFVAEAIDSGINYFDVAPSYGDAENRLGPALKGKRNDIFLACKTGDRTKEGARLSLENSLKNLKTDHFDLFQLHAMTTLEEVGQVFGPNGAMETLMRAKQNGIIRYIGFSAHSEVAALELMNRFQFDSVLCPINWVNIFNGDFGPSIIKKAQEKGIGILALKAMAKTKLSENADKKYAKAWYEPIDDKKLAGLALRYTLSQPITAAIPPGDIRLFRWALNTAKNFTPVSKEEEDILREKAKNLSPLFSK